MGAYFISSKQGEGEFVKKASSFNTENKKQFVVVDDEESKAAQIQLDSKKTKAYFVGEFFNKLLFKYSQSFSANKKTEIYLKRIKFLSLGGACGCLMLLFFSYSLSLTANSNLINEGEQRIKGSIDVFKRSPLSADHLENDPGVYRTLSKIN